MPRTITHRLGPIKVDGYQVKYDSNRVRAPRRDGYITYMHARVVDKRGNPLPVKRLMLHHVAFMNQGAYRGDKVDRTYCKGGKAERFYGTGEEDQELILPPGYGYKVGRRDRWKAGWMLMNHRKTSDEAYIEYTYTFDEAPHQEVKPYWVGVVPCFADPIYNIRGGGAPGSTHVKAKGWTAPVSGRIIAGGAHIHGGSKALVLSQPRCGDRSLIDNRPLYGLPDHPYYNVLPVLHEPGPFKQTWQMSASGIPIRKGEKLKIRAEYDAEHLHTRVMGIMHVYVAPDTSAAPRSDACEALPSDVQTLWPDVPHRKEAPYVRTPLTGLDSEGRAIEIQRPPGRTKRFKGDVTIRGQYTSWSVQNLSIPLGASVRWIFADRKIKHDVTLADGPIGFASYPGRDGESYRRRFNRPGTYKLFCSLHPVAMTQRIVVRGSKTSGRAAGAAGAGAATGSPRLEVQPPPGKAAWELAP